MAECPLRLGPRLLRAPRRAPGGHGHASYLVSSEDGERDQLDWNPEASRRARGFPIYAPIRSLGRSGIADLIDRCCAHARRFAKALAKEPGVEVAGRRRPQPGPRAVPGFPGNHDARTRAIVQSVQEDGTCWLGGTTWQGKGAIRISVSNWSTTEDVDRSVAAILSATQASNPARIES